jgi:hypothetical protein
VSLIQIENHTGDRRRYAVQAHPHGPHAVGVNRNAIQLGRGHRARQVEHQPVRIFRCDDRGFNRGAERDLDAQVTAIARYFHVLQRRGTACQILGHRQGHQH